MKFGSLFAGIGGMDLGLERAGMECAWQVEIDDYCQRVLTKHWPSVPKYGDIRNVGKENLKAVELICGGFPCQPFSTAGKQRGTDDDRHLWPEMLRVISELKPAWVIGENVPGIIPIFLDQAISDLEAEGYSTETIVLPACAFDAPHRRDRLFILAHANSSRRIHGETEKQSTKGRKQTFSEFEPSRAFVGNTYSGQRQRQKEEIRSGRNAAELASKDAPNPNSKRSQERGRQDTSRERTEQRPELSRITRWLPEPGVGRVANGVPRRVDRLRGLGNAVVPQVAEWIGSIILQEHTRRE